MGRPGSGPEALGLFRSDKPGNDAFHQSQRRFEVGEGLSRNVISGLELVD